MNSARIPVLGVIEIAIGLCGSLATTPMLVFLLLRGAPGHAVVSMENSVFGLPAAPVVAGGLVWGISLVIAGLMLTRRSRGGFALSMALLGACAAWLLYGMWRMVVDPNMFGYLPTIGTGLGAHLVRCLSLVLGAGALSLLGWGMKVLVLDWPTGGAMQRGRSANSG